MNSLHFKNDRRLISYLTRTHTLCPLHHFLLCVNWSVGSLPSSCCAEPLPLWVTFSLYLLLLHLSISCWLSTYLNIPSGINKVKMKKGDGSLVVRKAVLQSDESGLSSCICKPSSSSPDTESVQAQGHCSWPWSLTCLCWVSVWSSLCVLLMWGIRKGRFRKWVAF